MNTFLLVLDVPEGPFLFVDQQVDPMPDFVINATVGEIKQLCEYNHLLANKLNAKLVKFNLPLKALQSYMEGEPVPDFTVEGMHIMYDLIKVKRSLLSKTTLSVIDQLEQSNGVNFVLESKS